MVFSFCVFGKQNVKLLVIRNKRHKGLYVVSVTGFVMFYVLFTVSVLGIFNCSLFYDAFSVTKSVKRRMRGWRVNDELERIWKDALVV
jgi:hypothetical protein